MPVAALALAALLAQTPAQPLNWAADDAARVEELRKNGVRTEGQQVVLWTPAEVSDGDRRDLVTKLDRGIPALKRLVGRHKWQIVGDGKITYYVSRDRFISHATGRGAVFIPLARAVDSKAPYLHEATHEFVAAAPPRPIDPARRAARPLWLMEGFADFMAQTAADETGFPEGDVFDSGGLKGVDGVCNARLQQPIGDQVVRVIGEDAGIEALFTTDRQQVAPTFYSCSFSFTKFVVSKIGLPETIALMPLVASGGVGARLEKLTRMPIAQLREAWLRTIR